MITEIDFSAVSVEKALDELKSSANGLSATEVAERQKKFGFNQIPPSRKKSAFIIFIRQFKSILVAVLFFAGALSWITGHRLDTYIILIVVFIDALIGFIQEWRAEQAVSSLQKMLSPAAKVIRTGQRMLIDAIQLVPGDMIILEEGDHIPADARLIESKNLRSIESSLTGESLPVNKTKDTQEQTASIADKKNMVWKSTFIAGGYGRAVVTATGIHTVIGKVAKTLEAIPVEPSHFQKKINRLAGQMGMASVIAAMLLFVIGYLTLDLPLNELLLISVAAMVSIIPEGLPSIIVIVLAIGSRRMAKHNAIVREFTSTETLGAVTTIITDKTGTLTENALTVTKIWLWDEPDIQVTGEGWRPIGNFFQQGLLFEPANHPVLQEILRIAALCNNSSIRHDSNLDTYELIGDPTEGALLVLSRKGGIIPSTNTFKKLDDLPFSSSLKIRASLVRNDKNMQFLLVIGAPEVVLLKCTHVLTKKGIIPLDETIREKIRNKINSWSIDAMRVIALAYGNYKDAQINEKKINQLVFTAITGMIDPPREEVKDAVQSCREAGIRVIMATGDHISTAMAIAKAVGIVDNKQEVIALAEDQLRALDDKEFDEAVKTVNVFARLNPETKLRIAERLQAMGELIAMTGDGVNDAPALKKADVGIAMGIMGTDVARDAAKVVLADDNFSTIVHAIEQGRIVFMNARQASFYLITTNLAEISTLIVTVAFGFPMPLTAVQILWLNLVTDGIGDMALAAESGHGEALKVKPLHKDEKLLNKSILPFLAINVLFMTVLSLLAYIYFLSYSIEHARSAVFIVMSFTQLFNLYNMRSMTRSVFEIGIFSNVYITITMLSSALITILIIEAPFFKTIFGFGVISAIDFCILVLLSSLVLWVGEGYKYFKLKQS